MTTIHKAGKVLLLFCTGGCLYVLIELIARGYSHWSMALLGGLCFLCIGEINEHISWDMGLVQQCLLGSGIITALEFIAGLLLNVWLGLGIWDYSNLPLNLLGQICLPYSLLWVFLSLMGILLDDWLRWRFFHEERPHFRLI